MHILVHGCKTPSRRIYSSYSTRHKLQTEVRTLLDLTTKEADRLIEGIRLEFDAKKRKKMLMELQRVISEEQPYTFLWNVVNPAVYHKRIQGVKFYMPHRDITRMNGGFLKHNKSIIQPIN